MKTRVLKIILPISMLPWAAQAEDPVVLLSGGYTFTSVWGSSPGHGHGFELSLPIFPDDKGVVGFAPLLQGRWLDNDQDMSLTVGGELIGPLIGLEIAHSTRYRDGVKREGVHLGPFISAFGVFNLAGRFVMPIDEGAGEYGLTLSIKIPLPVAGEFNFGIGAPHGRPLRIAGQPVRVQVMYGPQIGPGAPGMSAEMRWRIAQAWIEDAQMEHASVAAFDLIADQLEGHGAPSALVAEARRAARDEADHARRCLSIAGALLGRPVYLAPIDDAVLTTARASMPTLSQMATDSLEEGCLGEAVAAAEITSAAWHAMGPVAAHMHTIAADEARHARLSEAIVTWAEGVGGVSVAAAVQAARAALPRHVMPRAEPHGVTARDWGRPTAEAQVHAFMRRRHQLTA
ncbi:MAG: ferritin-like domain-containing protein [Bradymonadia bacterium]